MNSEETQTTPFLRCKLCSFLFRPGELNTMNDKSLHLYHSILRIECRQPKKHGKKQRTLLNTRYPLAIRKRLSAAVLTFTLIKFAIFLSNTNTIFRLSSLYSQQNKFILYSNAPHLNVCFVKTYLVHYMNAHCSVACF